jgi:hypothetical protein
MAGSLNDIVVQQILFTLISEGTLFTTQMLLKLLVSLAFQIWGSHTWTCTW